MDPAGAHISLNGQRVVPRQFRIDSKPSLTHLHGIARIVSVGKCQSPTIEIFHVGAVVQSLARLATKANGPEAVLHTAAPARHQCALRLRRTFRDDVDHTVYCICSPQCGSRPADYLDAIDVLKQSVLNIPENTRI